MKKIVPLILFSAITLFGCNEKKADITQTVDWYVEHNQERKETLDECSNNPGELRGAPNCTNAAVAERMRATKSTKSYRF